MVEVSRQNNLLERAVRHFSADKVIVPDFAAAAKLQKLGVKEVVTEDGTEFKQGMISGGQHSNIFHLTFGTSQLDRQIHQLINEVSALEQRYDELKKETTSSEQESQLIKAQTTCELHIESLQKHLATCDS